jgi:hypothetical protein
MSQRIAGYDLGRVVALFRQAVTQVAELHTVAGLLHFDLKPRNILILEDGSLKLCDLDASMELGVVRGAGEKPGSSGYYAPEVARWTENPSSAPLVASAALDVWSLGGLLFELCSGRTLFRQDIGNDNLVDSEDLARLFTWRTISDRELAHVFGELRGHDDAIAAAKHLLRWCLKGLPGERPTVPDILRHPFLHGATADGAYTPLPRPLPMRYSFFISHAQMDAASTAKSFYNVANRLGVHCWYDMEQAQLTLEGMKQGVRDSDVLLLILTKNVLDRWFCQQEILTAIHEGKPIQLLVEEDERFAPFDAASWKGFQDFKRPQDHGEICAEIEAALPNAIVHRRRDYEADTMMRELLRRNGLALPMVASGNTARCELQPNQQGPTRLAVLCNRGGSGGDMCDELLGELERVKLLDVSEDAQAVDSADKVLLLLSDGVLQGDTLASLCRVLEADRAARMDRLVLVCRTKQEGWSFDKEENKDLRDAPDEVRTALKDHEAITYRSRSTQASRHEFPAMIGHLMNRLLPRGGFSVAGTQQDTPVAAPVPTVRQQLEDALRVAAEREAENERLRSALVAPVPAVRQQLEDARAENERLRSALQQRGCCGLM